jgi:hypothetical protein
MSPLYKFKPFHFIEKTTTITNFKFKPFFIRFYVSLFVFLNWIWSTKPSLHGFSKGLFLLLRREEMVL